MRVEPRNSLIIIMGYTSDQSSDLLTYKHSTNLVTDRVSFTIHSQTFNFTLKTRLDLVLRDSVSEPGVHVELTLTKNQILAPRGTSTVHYQGFIFHTESFMKIGESFGRLDSSLHTGNNSIPLLLSTELFPIRKRDRLVVPIVKTFGLSLL